MSPTPREENILIADSENDVVGLVSCSRSTTACSGSPRSLSAVNSIRFPLTFAIIVSG